MDHRKERIGVIPPEGFLASATRLPDGRYWYSYGKPALVGEYESYGQERDECKAALARFFGPSKAIAA